MISVVDIQKVPWSLREILRKVILVLARKFSSFIKFYSRGLPGFTSISFKNIIKPVEPQILTDFLNY